MNPGSSKVFSIPSLIMMALLVALEIVLARFFSIQTDVLRISIETVPLALAGMWMGPLAGVIVAVVSDILGMLIAGYGVYFPPMVLGPVIFALMCGCATKYIFKSSLSSRGDGWKLILVLILAGFINSFVVGVVTVTWYQMVVLGTSGSFWTLAALNFTGRLASKPLTIIVSTVLVYLINKAIYPFLLKGNYLPRKVGGH